MKYTALTFPITGLRKIIQLNGNSAIYMTSGLDPFAEERDDYVNCYTPRDGKIELHTTAGLTKVTNIRTGANDSEYDLDSTWVKKWLCEFMHPVYAIQGHQPNLGDLDLGHTKSWFGFIFENPQDAMLFKLSCEKMLSLTTTDLTESIFV